jgi:hypothetical protein
MTEEMRSVRPAAVREPLAGFGGKVQHTIPAVKARFARDCATGAARPSSRAKGTPCRHPGSPQLALLS